MAHDMEIPRTTPTEGGGVPWEPIGGEVFVHSMVHDISDPEGALETPPIAVVLGLSMTDALSAIRRECEAAGQDVTPELIEQRLRDEHPELWQKLTNA